MNFITQQGQRVIIKEIPFLLLLSTALFSLPFLTFSLFHIVRGTDAEGKWFCLFVGLLLGWLLLEFVATRETIAIDPNLHTFSRTVRGVFRKREQVIDLSTIKSIKLEIKRDSRSSGRRRQYLYLCGNGKQLVNTPSKTYKNHRKTGDQLSQITGLPFETVSC